MTNWQEENAKAEMVGAGIVLGGCLTILLVIVVLIVIGMML